MKNNKKIQNNNFPVFISSAEIEWYLSIYLSILVFSYQSIGNFRKYIPHFVHKQTQRNVSFPSTGTDLSENLLYVQKICNLQSEVDVGHDSLTSGSLPGLVISA